MHVDIDWPTGDPALFTGDDMCTVIGLLWWAVQQPNNMCLFSSFEQFLYIYIYIYIYMYTHTQYCILKCEFYNHFNY